MKNFEEQFGKEGTDIITGFKGIISGYSHYITGCGSFLLNPGVDKDGKKRDGQWIDEGRIEFGKMKVVLKKPESLEEKGGDIEAPIK